MTFQLNIAGIIISEKPEPIESIRVDMNEQKIILYTPTDTRSKEIYTQGLTGSTALAVFIECTNPDNDPSKILMSHSIAGNVIQRLEQILKAAAFKDCACPNSEIKSTEAIVVTPWDTPFAKEDSLLNLYNKSKIKNNENKDDIIDSVRILLNTENIKIIPYAKTCEPFYRDWKKYFKVTVESGSVSYESLADRYESHQLNNNSR